MVNNSNLENTISSDRETFLRYEDGLTDPKEVKRAILKITQEIFETVDSNALSEEQVKDKIVDLRTRGEVLRNKLTKEDKRDLNFLLRNTFPAYGYPQYQKALFGKEFFSKQYERRGQAQQISAVPDSITTSPYTNSAFVVEQPKEEDNLTKAVAVSKAIAGRYEHEEEESFYYVGALDSSSHLGSTTQPLSGEQDSGSSEESLVLQVSTTPSSGVSKEVSRHQEDTSSRLFRPVVFFLDLLIMASLSLAAGAQVFYDFLGKQRQSQKGLTAQGEVTTSSTKDIVEDSPKSDDMLHALQESPRSSRGHFESGAKAVTVQHQESSRPSTGRSTKSRSLGSI